MGGITGAQIRGNEAWPEVTAVRTEGRKMGQLKAAEEVTPGLRGRVRVRGPRGGIYSRLVGGNKRTARSPRDFLLPPCDEGGA